MKSIQRAANACKSSMNPKRPPPAFQWYASDVMADEAFMLASLAERGLYTTLNNYCWVNRSIPNDPTQMAKLLGLQEDDIQKLVKGPLITKHFDCDNSRLFCPELERQRQSLLERQEKMVNGGRKGGKKTQENNRSHPSSLAKAPEMSRGELSREEVSQKKDIITDEEWNKARH